MDTSFRALVNGKPQTSIDVRDRGLTFGDGVFETMAMFDGRALGWDLHLQRMCDGARRLGLAVPDGLDWERDVQSLCVSARRAILKLILTRGISEQGYRHASGAAPTRIVTLSAWKTPAEAWDTGVAVRLCRQTWSRQPALAGIKHLGRLEQVLARGEWADEYAEGLMRDDRGDVISATASNLFVLVDGVLCTPDLSSSGVCGTVRASTMTIARRLQIPLEVRRIPLTLLVEHAEEVFLTNSLIGIWPVVRIEGRTYPFGDTTRKLRDELVRQGLVAAP